MQFGHALDRLLREILLANPQYGPVLLMKLDIADGFYRMDLNIDDISKLGVFSRPSLVTSPSLPSHLFCPWAGLIVRQSLPLPLKLLLT